MEAIVVFVGFLGAGKTTLLKKVVKEYLEASWSPFIILNDYENAQLDAQDFLQFLSQEQISALSGSCICCSGVNELRLQVNQIPKREKGITLIEANGTTDAASLMGFLGVGMAEHFLPPIQVAVVDARHWQRRGWNNELEANQIQVSSMIVINYENEVSSERLAEVEQDLQRINPHATLTHWEKLDISSFPALHPIQNELKAMDHRKAHWASCSVDLPDPIATERLKEIVGRIPETILRVKACTKLDENEHYSYLERVPSGEAFIRPYHGIPVTGPKLLTIGPGSNPDELRKAIAETEEAIPNE